MTRRNSYPGGKWFNKPGQAYARTSSWPTRYYQRKIGGSMVAALAGINTTADDFSKKEGESPYLWNARLSGTKEDRKRAQSMSRMGQMWYGMPDGSQSSILKDVGDFYIGVREDKSIRWKIHQDSTIISVGLRFKIEEPSDDTNAHFVLILRDENMNEICRAIRSVSEIEESVTKYGELHTVWFRFIKTLSGDGYLEATLVDDLDNNGRPADYTLYINASGEENHSYSEHELPNLDKALREKPYTWYRGVNVPVTQFRITNWKTFPVWLQGGHFNSGGSRYSVIGAIDSDGNKKIFKVKYADCNINTGEIVVRRKTTVQGAENPPEFSLLIDYDKIDQRATQVRMTQAGNELYFVDGYSNLQRVNLDTWEISDAVPNVNDIDTFGYAGNMYYFANSIIVDGESFWRCNEDHQGRDTFDADEQKYWTSESVESLTAWPGASLIYFINNRIALSGFRNIPIGEDPSIQRVEPNLVILSSITSVRPQYEIFNKSVEFFYVPDRSPSQSVKSPVSAFASIGDYLFVFTTDGYVVETIQSAVEFGGIAQSIPEGAQYGVMKQEHVAEGTNMIYYYNREMGIMRTAGSVASIISSPIDSFMQGIKDEQAVTAHLCMTGDVLRFYIGENDSVNTISFVDYVGITQHKSYWFRDNNTPVQCTYIDGSSDFYMAVHSQVPAMMVLDETLKDFDCAILYEYYTKYIGTPDRLDHTIVRRVHVTTLQTFQSSVFIGLDYDHNNTPIVWRKFITPTQKGTFAPEDIFGDDNESGATNLDIRILTTDTRFVQIRLKQYCYDFQAEILQVGFEYANRTTL